MCKVLLTCLVIWWGCCASEYNAEFRLQDFSPDFDSELGIGQPWKHRTLAWMARKATIGLCVCVCPPEVGGSLCLLSLGWLHLHSQPPLLILLVTQFTIACLGPVFGVCPMMTTAVSPSSNAFNAGQPADTPTANLWENMPSKCSTAVLLSINIISKTSTFIT